MKPTSIISKKFLYHSYRTAAALFSLLVIFGLLFSFFLSGILPDKYYVARDGSFSIGDGRIVKAYPDASAPLSVYSSPGSSYKMKLRLFGTVSIKDVSVQVVDRRVVSLCGTPFGIKMMTDGVIVVGTGSVTGAAKPSSPAKDAGIREGDLITSINGTDIRSKKQISQFVGDSLGQPMSITVQRGSKTENLSVTPVKSANDNAYHLGLWVRDSSAGIGTMTFFDPQTNCFAGLGHAVCDVDTGQLMPLSSGEIVEASIIGIEPGHAGKPGQLQGAFVSNRPVGRLYLNRSNGVYGKLFSTPSYSQTIPMAHVQEVTEGAVKILTTVEGEKPRMFDAQIEKLSLDQNEPTKNMVLRITDPELLKLSGGIVQGMSGSPIIQNGMLVGAVTHVFVNDCTRGYGIFAENMDTSLLSLSQNSVLTAAG